MFGKKQRIIAEQQERITALEQQLETLTALQIFTSVDQTSG